MEINWLTVFAQVVNFLILVFLLKRFLYAPIVNAMDRREQHIAERLRSAQEREVEAKHESQRFLEKTEQLESEKKSLLEEAKQDVQRQKNEQLESLREELASLRKRWQNEVESEKQTFMQQAREAIGQQAIRIARKALEDLAGAKLEQQLIDKMVNKIEHMESKRRSELRSVIKEQDVPINVLSSFALNQEAKKNIRDALQEVCGTSSIDMVFRVEPGVLYGIELQFSEHKLTWSLDGYMDDLESSLEEALSTTEPTLTEMRATT